MNTATIKTDGPIYLLLGEQAIDAFEEGIDAFAYEVLHQKFDFQLAAFNDGESLFVVLNTLDGFFGWAFLDEKEYNGLKKIYDIVHPEDINEPSNP
ncbi:MAG: hypothetical protein IT245_07060 [Bacteroidia bacterium]|nr:hypothetical protein [Bacteroidia bacterium]